MVGVKRLPETVLLVPRRFCHDRDRPMGSGGSDYHVKIVMVVLRGKAWFATRKGRVNYSKSMYHGRHFHIRVC